MLRIKKPLKDGLLLKGLYRGNFDFFSPHLPPPLSVINPTENHKGDAEMKD
jgi:hypothetical protein